MSRKRAGDAGRSDHSGTLASALQADEYKVIIIGALGAGKTSMLLRYVHDTFEDRISRFVSEERKTITAAGKEIVLDIWDTAGEGGREGRGRERERDERQRKREGGRERERRRDRERERGGRVVT